MLEILIRGIKPISVNDAYYRAGNFNAKARAYRAAFLTQLIKCRGELDSFRASANTLIEKKSHCLNMTIVHNIPEDQFYTKDGRMNAHAGDVDNYTKLIQDFLCDHKYSETNVKKPFYIDKEGQSRSVNLDMNDKLIQASVAIKLPSASTVWVIQVRVTVDLIRTVL